jgi:hypothetical protein
MTGEPLPPKHLLFNVCTRCEHLYFWCPHTNTSHRKAAPAEAVVALSKMALAYRCSPEEFSGYASIDWHSVARAFGVKETIDGF